MLVSWCMVLENGIFRTIANNRLTGGWALVAVIVKEPTSSNPLPHVSADSGPKGKNQQSYSAVAVNFKISYVASFLPTS
jgi:hypothetical protein